MPESQHEKQCVRLIASPKNWIDGEAVRQLEETGRLPGMRSVVGLPDLHPGKGTPVGAAFVSEGVFYPFLVGNDVGCGMALWVTDLPRKKLKLDRWVKKLSGLEGPWDGNTADRLAREGLSPTDCDRTLGTIGGGNHFAELQVVEQVQDLQALSDLGLSPEHLALLIHSGSRSLGEALWTNCVAAYGRRGMEESSEQALAYLAEHDRAVKWACVNRAIIAERFLSNVGSDGRRLVDISHNTVGTATIGGRVYRLHRKGVAPSDQGPIVIPGSRGTLTYLVVPIGDQESNAHSLAHGAGRKWGRSQSRERLGSRYTAESLTRTELGGRVICEDRDLLYQEAPQAYKNIDIVVNDMLDAGLIRIIATLRPLITYKTRRTE